MMVQDRKALNILLLFFLSFLLQLRWPREWDHEALMRMLLLAVPQPCIPSSTVAILSPILPLSSTRGWEADHGDVQRCILRGWENILQGIFDIARETRRDLQWISGRPAGTAQEIRGCLLLHGEEALLTLLTPPEGVLRIQL